MTRSVFFALALIASGAATSAHSATKAEQAACRSDAMKLCSDHVGKPSEMNVCLRDHKTELLSEACRAVVEHTAVRLSGRQTTFLAAAKLRSRLAGRPPSGHGAGLSNEFPSIFTLPSNKHPTVSPASL